MQANFLDLYYQDNMSDKSHAIDFNGLWAQGIIGIAHKASQGLHFRDPLCAARRKLCLAQTPQMLWIYYHFLDSSSADYQAENFLGAVAACEANLNATVAPPGYGLAADYEKNGGNTAALHQLQTFCTITDPANPGALTIIYSSDLIRETLKPPQGGHVDADMIGVADFFQRHPFWLAEYGPHENIPWPWNKPSPNETTPPGVAIWQFNDHGRFASIIGPVDVNYIEGGRDRLAKLLPALGVA